MFQVDSADFDGTGDAMTRGADLTGNADSKSGILSVWVRLDGGDGNALDVIEGTTTVGGTTPRFFFTRIATTNLFRVQGRNAAGTVILQADSNTAYTAGATWLHLLASWDLATAAAHFYVNDSSDLAAGSTLTDDTIDYTLADWGVGAKPDASTFLFNGCIAEFYFAPGQFMDFSSASNRRKFISGEGKPVFLGNDGSTPTGTIPQLMLHLANGEAVANFATNRAAGGNFSITGTLTTGSTSPSD